MDLYPKRDELLKRTRALSRKWETSCELELFRFVDPRFCAAADIVSAVTQAWGAAIAAAGFEAAIAPSAALPDRSNVLIFPDNLQASSHFTVEREVVVP